MAPSNHPSMWLEDCEKPDFMAPIFDLDIIARENIMRKREIYEEQLFEPIQPERMQKPLHWVVNGWLPEGTLAVLAGDPKAGKTSIATALALAVATGTPFAGMETTQGGVLWLAGEESRAERWQLLKDSPLADDATPLFTCYQHVPIDSEEGQFLLGKWISKSQAKLLVVDPLYMATSGRSMESAAGARRSMMPLKQLCTTYGIAALVLHHAKLPRPGQEEMRVAENAQLAASAGMDCVLSWRQAMREPGQPPARIVSLSCRGRGSFANTRLRLLSEGPLHYAPFEKPVPVPASERTNWRENKVLELLREGPNTTEKMCERLNMNDAALRSAVTTLRRKRLIQIVDVVEKERFWGLVEA